MSVELPDDLLADLRRDEGWRAKPYFDTEGYLTIGYGFLIDERKGVVLPRAVGDLWLELGARDRWEQLLARAPWIAEQPPEVQRALGNMAYQLGVDGLLGFRRMLVALQAGARELAAWCALESKWAKQTPERAERVAALIRGLDAPLAIRS